MTDRKIGSNLKIEDQKQSGDKNELNSHTHPIYDRVSFAGNNQAGSVFAAWEFELAFPDFVDEYGIKNATHN